MRTSLVALSLVLFGGSACDKKAEPTPAPTGGEKAPAPKPTIDPAVVASVDAKVPEAFKGKVAFEVVEGEKGHILAVQPKGWATGVIPGRVKPADDAGLGFLTAFGTGTNCDGTCESKDWAAVTGEVEFAQFTGGGWQIDKDEKLADGRLLVAKKEGRVDIALARWKAGASRYYYCRATLEDSLVDAAAAFEEACRQMVVPELDAARAAP